MKSGYLTTEFWVATLTIIAATVLCALDDIDATAWATATGVVSAGYQFSRGLAKVNPPKD
jgi:hypothetical protein